jgi:hypothetical protein
MRDVATKKEGRNYDVVPSKRRRKLTGWNVFTKRKSLERILGRKFEDDNDFVAFVCDNDEFKYQNRRDRRRNRKRIMNDKIKTVEQVVEKLSSESVTEEYNNLTHEQRDEYEFIADGLNKLRDE